MLPSMCDVRVEHIKKAPLLLTRKWHATTLSLGIRKGLLLLVLVIAAETDAVDVDAIVMAS